MFFDVILKAGINCFTNFSDSFLWDREDSQAHNHSVLKPRLLDPTHFIYDCWSQMKDVYEINTVKALTAANVNLTNKESAANIVYR